MPESDQHYFARGGAVEVFETQAREVLVEGPTRTGKTRALLEKAYAVALKYPFARVLLVRKTRASMSESVMQTLEEHVFPPNASWVGTASRSHRERYTLPNGSVIVAGGMDHTDKIMSSEWDRVFAFEWTEASEADHEKLLTRLSNDKTPFRQVICDCNPAHPGHWLNQRASIGKMARVHVAHRDNPKFHDGVDWTKLGREYLGTLEALTGVRRERYLLGRWATADGLVYPEYGHHTHVIDAMPPGWQEWKKYRSIDFGYNDPFVCQWWADSGEALYLYREIYMSSRIVSAHAETIKRLSGTERYIATVADHDREDRETLHAAGVQTTTANKAIDRGLDAVRSRLKVQQTGRPRLYILRTALTERDQTLSEAKRPCSTIEEFDSYVFGSDNAGKSKEKPVDRDNHGMDAMRYAVMAVDSRVGGTYVGVLDGTW